MLPDKTKEEIKDRSAYLKTVKRGKKFLDAGLREEGLEVFEESSRLAPGLAPPYFRMAELYELMGDIDKADEYYKKFLKVFYRNSAGWYYFGNFLEKRGRLAEAEVCLKNAIRWEPFNKTAYDLLARIFAKQNRLQEADISFQRALIVDSDYGASHLNYGLFLDKLGVKKSALMHLKRAFELGMSNQLSKTLIKLYERQGLKG